MRGRGAGIFVVVSSLACGPIVDDGTLEQPVYSAHDDHRLACVPVDDGCLRLQVDIPAKAIIEGELVEATCDASDEPLAAVEAFDGDTFMGHGTLYIIGALSLDDGTVLDLWVPASRVEIVDDAQCD